MRATLLAALLLAACLVPAESAVAEPFTSESYGFKIDRPEGWTFSEPKPPAGALYGAKLAKIKDNTETSVTVYVTRRAATIKDSKGARDASEATWKDAEEISNIKRGKGELNGREAHWLKAAYDIGTKYTLRQHFMVKDDYVYILQSVAPEGEFDRADKDLTALLETFDFVTPDPDAARLKALAAKCGSELKWAESWAAASKRARDENRLVLVVFEVYRGLDVEVYSPKTLFMQRDIVELVSERFVPMYWTETTRAPFDDPKVFGLGPSTFGQGIMFATAEGKIVGQVATFDAFDLYDSCRNMLKDHPGAPPKDPADTAELLRRGDHDAASALLKAPTTEAEWRLQGDLYRRQRNGAKSVDALKKAGDAAASLALTHLNQGQDTLAEKAAAKAESPEGVFWHCLATAKLKGYVAVNDRLRKLALDNPDNRWSWWAAAILADARMQALPLLLIWPSERQVQSWRHPGYEVIEDAAAAREGAIAFLVGAQGSDGRWVNVRSHASVIFDAAVSALCATALLPHLDNELAAGAVESALRWLLQQELVADGDALFNYTIWAQIFTLDFMARCVEAKVGDKRATLKAMAAIITDMEARQYPGGGWGYFYSPDAPDNSIGFVTAAAVLALQRAETAGASLGGRTLHRACEALEALAHKNGSYGYMAAMGPGSDDKQAEASLRSPLYALALKRAGRGNALRAALDVYAKHRKHTIAERGKCMCHTGAEGTAPYYLLFGYRFAAESLAELPEKDRAKYKQALTSDVLQMRQKDGSFCDYLGTGREYGAAMALTALDLLEP